MERSIPSKSTENQQQKKKMNTLLTAIPYGKLRITRGKDQLRGSQTQQFPWKNSSSTVLQMCSNPLTYVVPATVWA